MSAAEGHCLCGAVRIRVERHATDLSACHCSMCRRWSGAMQFGFDVPADAIAIEGPVKVYRSSAFAERAWCDDCGSALWLRDTDTPGRPYELVPGLFDLPDLRLDREVYADRCPPAYALAGEHRRITAAEYEAAHPHVDDQGARP